MTDPNEEAQAAAGARRRAEALREAARGRTARAEQAVEKGIRALIKDGGQISFAAVARASGVSTKFLHQHPDLSSRIKALRAQQGGLAEARHGESASGESAVIAALRRQLREQQERHRAETKDLRTRLAEQERQIAALYGRLGAEQDAVSPMASRIRR